MLVIMLPQEAKKTSLLMGLRKEGEERKEMTMTAVPIRETTEQTRSVNPMAYRWCGGTVMVFVLGLGCPDVFCIPRLDI